MLCKGSLNINVLSQIFSADLGCERLHEKLNLRVVFPTLPYDAKSVTRRQTPDGHVFNSD